MCSKAVNAIQLYIFNLFHFLKGKNCQQNEKPAVTIIDTPIYSKNGTGISSNLRIIQEYSQPKIGRKIRIFSLGRKFNIFVLKKKEFININKLK